MKTLLFVSILSLIVACGKDNKTEDQPAVSAIQCRGNQQIDGNGNVIYNNGNNYSSGSIYNTNGYCLNGQWVTTNNQNQTGYFDANGRWVQSGPFYQNGSGSFVPFNPNNGWYYPSGGAYYRTGSDSGSWNWKWKSW